jgi:hypothetical protein
MEASRLLACYLLSPIAQTPNAKRQTPTRRYAHTPSLGYQLSTRRRPEIMDTEMDKLENDHYHQDTKYPDTRSLVAR